MPTHVKSAVTLIIAFLKQSRGEKKKAHGGVKRGQRRTWSDFHESESSKRLLY